MFTVNSMCRVFQRGLRTSGQLSRAGCEGRSRHPDHRKALCEELKESHCCSGKKKKPKTCDKGEDKGSRKQSQAESEEAEGQEGFPEQCTKQMALDCARRIAELQKQWEAVARQVERAQEAAERAGQRKKMSGCPVKPPKQEEPPKSNTPLVLGLIAMAAALGYYIYTQTLEVEEDKGDKEDKKPEDQG